MRCCAVLRALFVVCVASCLANGTLRAQDDPELKPPLADDQAGWVARGILKTIPPDVLQGETFTGPLPLGDVAQKLKGVDYTPNFEPKTQTVFERAKEVTLRRTIWGLEFDFKPVRFAEVDVPQPEGRMKRKLIWYMLYRVRNLGGHLEPTGEPGQAEEIRTRLLDAETTDLGKQQAQQEIDQNRLFSARAVSELPKDAFPQVIFFPSFILQAHDFDKEYLDRVIPAALPVIAKRERVGKPIFDSVTISKQKIPVTTADVDNSVWGVATWEDVDPRIDFFSVYVPGLTNAFRYTQQPGKPRVYTRKTLQLHFWRPGDTINESEKEVRFGMPTESDAASQAEINQKYGEKDRLDYRWIYR